MMIDYERQLLEKLLKKYEHSQAYASGYSPRKIAVTASKASWLQSGMEDPEEKKLFFDALENLKLHGIVDYSWIKFEEGNLVDKIWLVQDEERIREGYRRIGQTPTKEKADHLCSLIEKYAQNPGLGKALRMLMAAWTDEIRRRRKRPSCFTDDEILNEDILKCLVYMDNNDNEQMERVMSLSLYGDSKRFERAVKSKVTAILKILKKTLGEDIPEAEELLREKGIVRWPEIMEFAGKIKIHLDDGSAIDYSTEKYGAYINSETIVHAVEVRTEDIHKVIFIENKANYVWYLSHEMTENELVVLHGGCYSPVKGQWFHKIVEGTQRQSIKVSYVHWGDIDAGGFQIFQRLRDNIVPELKPYRMDRKSLEQYMAETVKITSQPYLKVLKSMAENPAYACFHDVLEKMVQEKIRLEQEAMIL